MIAADGRSTVDPGPDATYRDDRLKVRAFPERDLLVGCCDEDLVADRIFDVLGATVAPRELDELALHEVVMRERFRVATGMGRSWPRVQVLAAFGAREAPRLIRLIADAGYDPIEEQSICWWGLLADAGMLLRRYCRPSISSDALIRLLVAAISETAAVSPVVGGAVSVGVLDSNGARMLPAGDVEAVGASGRARAACWSGSSRDPAATLQRHAVATAR